MIQLFLFGGGDVFRYGVQNLAVVIILIAEVLTVLLGIVFGLLTRNNRKMHVSLLVPGIIGCLIFAFINTFGRTIISDAHIWLPLLAEDLVLFSVTCWTVLTIKKRCKPTNNC